MSTRVPVPKPALLIVDDDPLVCESLAAALEAEFEVHASATRLEAVALVRRLPQAPRLALVDLGLPPTPQRPDEGFALIAELLAHLPGMRIFVLSGQNHAAHARHALSLGAAQFFAKPCEAATLRRALQRAFALHLAEASHTSGMEDLCGRSHALLKLRRQVMQLADTAHPVLIEGESGTGKELVARSLHRLSLRAARPYLALNCAAISPALLEPALFGHVKGAYTGAAAGKAGYFEETQDGTLLLDEIGELPLELQPKLLRVLENGEFQRVGETTRRLSRARIVAATNRDLRRAVRVQAFRADLYHRISVFTLATPALRDMNGDRLTLLERFRLYYAEQSGARPFTLDAAAEQRWLAYAFPGNVRELRNIVIRLSLQYPGQLLAAAEVEAEFDLEALDPRTAPRSEGDALEQALSDLEHHRSVDLDLMVRTMERAYLDAALRIARGNISQASRMLGIHRTTFYGRLAANPSPWPSRGALPRPD